MSRWRCSTGLQVLELDEDDDGCLAGRGFDIDNDGRMTSATRGSGPYLLVWNPELLPGRTSQSDDVDGDGCADDQKINDVNDGVVDAEDRCTPETVLTRVNGNQLETDYDLDGCKDTGEVNSGFGEDEDDDNDGVNDDMANCDPESGFRTRRKIGNQIWPPMMLTQTDATTLMKMKIKLKSNRQTIA